MLPAIELAGLRVPTHDLFSLTGILVGLAIYYRELRRRGMLDERILIISLTVLIGGGLGARLLLAWEHLPYYVEWDGASVLSLIEHSGKSLIGAVAGGYLAGVLAKRALGYRRSTGDCYALAIPVAVAIGRVGCFLAELPLGTPTDLPWGMSVSPEAAAAFPGCTACAGTMHPSMLYEIGFNLAAIALIVRFRRRVVVQGDVLKTYLLAAALFRFLVEFVRGNPPQALGLTGPQWVLLPLTALLVIHFARELRSGVLHVPLAPPVASS